MKLSILALGMIMATASQLSADVIGEVASTWKMFGGDKIKIERFDDPEVENASCYVSYADTGGLFGSFAENPSRFSIACRATGPVRVTGTVGAEFEEVFKQSSSVFFKEMRVSRMLDADKNVLVYLVWSTKLIDGSPFNSVTAIPIQ